MIRKLRAWLLRLGALFAKQRRERELADELVLLLVTIGLYGALLCYPGGRAATLTRT